MRKNKIKTHPEINGLLDSLLSSHLYPHNQFPRHLFPDLESILKDFYCTYLEGKRKQELAKVLANPDLIENDVMNVLDFYELLKDHPEVIIQIYLHYIRRFIQYKHQANEERDDMVQEVVTRLLAKKIQAIQNHFKPENHKKCTFTSYFIATVRNIYMDIIRERKVRLLTSNKLDWEVDLEKVDIEVQLKDWLIIEEELNKFSTLLKLYYKIQARLKICLKLKYRIEVDSADVRNCFPECSSRDQAVLTQDFRLIKDEEMFRLIIEVFNLHENKQSRSDTLRKWTDLKIDELIVHMNNTHKGNSHQVYNNKNIGDLITLYFDNYRKATQNSEFICFEEVHDGIKRKQIN